MPESTSESVLLVEREDHIAHHLAQHPPDTEHHEMTEAGGLGGADYDLAPGRLLFLDDKGRALSGEGLFEVVK